MAYENISYRSYCWVLGTTSFRVAQMNLRIEEQLVHLRSFSRDLTSRGERWKWTSNKDLQKRFYYYLQDQGALKGDAPRPDKDARQKTSGLPTLGFTDKERVITPAGKELLEYVEDGTFGGDNYFMIPADSFIYLKQLLKTALEVGDGGHVRPYLVLAHFLNEFGYLTFDELRFLLPLVVDEQSLRIVTSNIDLVRSGKVSFDKVIVDSLMAKENYKQAFALWLENAVDEELVTTIGMNRKSRSYDRVYFPFYQSLKRVFVEHRTDTEEIFELYRRLKKLPTAGYWKQLLFGDTHPRRIRTGGAACLSRQNQLFGLTTEFGLKREFFKLLHLFKAKATLADYFDLNRRYFKLTDTVLFRDETVRFDSIPAAFFSLVGDKLSQSMFQPCTVLTEALPLASISPIFAISQQELLSALSDEFGVEIATLSKAKDAVTDERYQRLHELLDNRFTKEVFIELLDCFLVRDDSRIQELVTEDATPSTIFEYVLALIWYEFSGRTGDVLSFMKLSFEADLMPRTHAQGGGADVIFEFDEAVSYPKHDMLIEATLADGANARRMEMEPVSRHLGNHVLETGNSYDYCVFVAPEIDVNVANDFRSRKQSGFWSKDGANVPLKIIPIDIGQVRDLVEGNSVYSELYQKFQLAHDSLENNPIKWREEIATLIST